MSRQVRWIILRKRLLRTGLSDTLENRTLILITHRGSMLSLVDRLVIVDAGRVVADGPKEDVMDALRKGQVRGAQ